METANFAQMLLQANHKTLWKQSPSILPSLPVTDRQLSVSRQVPWPPANFIVAEQLSTLEIQILHPHSSCLYSSQATSIQQPGSPTQASSLKQASLTIHRFGHDPKLLAGQQRETALLRVEAGRVQGP